MLFQLFINNIYIWLPDSNQSVHNIADKLVTAIAIPTLFEKKFF